MLVTRDRLEFIYSDVNETALEGVRGSGKTQAIATSAYYNMNTYPGAKVLIFVPNNRLVTDMFWRICSLGNEKVKIGRQLKRQDGDEVYWTSNVRLRNGSEVMIFSFAGATGSRGISANIIYVDELPLAVKDEELVCTIKGFTANPYCKVFSTGTIQDVNFIY
jgi:CRISPR/Cas system-associated endonuclease/helicase Cas3